MSTETAKVKNRLRELRKRRGLGQAELAKLTGLSRTTVYLLETGQRSNPAPATLKTLSQFFGVSRSYLLGFDDEEGGSPKGGAPELLRRLRELDAEDRRLLLRGLWSSWGTDVEADAWGTETAIQFLRESGASADELRKLLTSLDPLEVRRLIAESSEQQEAEQAYRHLLFESTAAGDLTPAEASRKAEQFGAA